MAALPSPDNTKKPQDFWRQASVFLLGTAAGSMFFNLFSNTIGYLGVAVVAMAGALIAVVGWLRQLPRRAPLARAALPALLCLALTATVTALNAAWSSVATVIGAALLAMALGLTATFDHAVDLLVSFGFVASGIALIGASFVGFGENGPLIGAVILLTGLFFVVVGLLLLGPLGRPYDAEPRQSFPGSDDADFRRFSALPRELRNVIADVLMLLGIAIAFAAWKNGGDPLPPTVYLVALGVGMFAAGAAMRLDHLTFAGVFVVSIGFMLIGGGLLRYAPASSSPFSVVGNSLSGIGVVLLGITLGRNTRINFGPILLISGIGFGFMGAGRLDTERVLLGSVTLALGVGLCCLGTTHLLRSSAILRLRKKIVSLVQEPPSE